MIEQITRRRILETLGASVASLSLVSSIGVAEQDGMHSTQGELPNDNVPHTKIHAAPQERREIEVGQFTIAANGWRGFSAEKMREFLNKFRQVYTIGDQTFILDSVDDWTIRGDDIANGVRFTHTDPPRPQGEVFTVTWDGQFTAPFYDPVQECWFAEGDGYSPHGIDDCVTVPFPFRSTYEIVNKD